MGLLEPRFDQSDDITRFSRFRCELLTRWVLGFPKKPSPFTAWTPIQGLVWEHRPLECDVRLIISIYYQSLGTTTNGFVKLKIGHTLAEEVVIRQYFPAHK